MNRERVDLLVIGLGPAGAAAAARAARAGLSVLAVEKKKQIGVPIQCAEFIPLPLAGYAQAPGVLAQRIAGMLSTLPSGAVRASGFGGFMVDRAAFDQALAHAAERAGAKLVAGTVLCALDARRGTAVVRRGREAIGVEFHAAIAADGPFSTSAELIGLPRLKIVRTRQYTVPLLVPCATTDIWLSDAYPGGYAWLFPRAKHANLGLGLDPRFDGDMKTPLDALHRRLVAAGRVGPAILSATGGAIPVGGLRERLVAGRVLFAGDAAGLTHPITGAGIAAAIVSGERAAQAAHAFVSGNATGALQEYEVDIRDQFAGPIERALARRAELERAWRTAAARGDAVHRRGWIAFEEYFQEAAA